MTRSPPPASKSLILPRGATTGNNNNKVEIEGVAVVADEKAAAEAAKAAAPRRRVNRRASTGAYRDFQNGKNGGKADGGEGDDSSRHGERRSTLSKQQSQEKLMHELAMVNDYRDPDDKIELLRERLNQGKKNVKQKPRKSRRSSISSITSTSSQMSSSQRDPSLHSRGYRDESDWSVTDVSESRHSEAPSRTSITMSSNTLPVNNIVKSDQSKRRENRTEQVVESLVWFSFHTPRTVLEDLIANEMDIFRRENKRGSLSQALSNLNKASGAQTKQQQQKDYKMSYMRRDDDSSEEDDTNDGTLSTLSEDGQSVVLGDLSQNMLRLQGTSSRNKMLQLPKSVRRESALLFCDMSGFTKLSTLLDVESLSKVINSYFDMIVSEVLEHGGDILKFAGDAFFAEWRAVDEEEEHRHSKRQSALADLNASLASFNDISLDLDDDIPKLSICVLSAARCATAIVKKYSDYQVTSAANTSEAMLNVHCGIGVGSLVGLHVGDYKEEQEEDGVELRREFLLLGSPIDQVAKAADIATDGEVFASREAMLQLAFCCEVSEEHRESVEPVRIASRDEAYLDLFREDSEVLQAEQTVAAQPYESLRLHCKSLDHNALARLHLQMALYVHPVIRGAELALSAAIQQGKIAQPTEALESRHRAEAELRSVFTIFINVVLSPRITGQEDVDEELFTKLNDVMHVTSRELDRYSGHLRQFIVDDKGVVLIATFGLRGSTFPNMISNNGLPAVFAIHRALKTELKVENRIGATFGKVYCGVAGGVRRHEFAVMGAAVNLAARLMSSKVNKGILVDEAVREQADSRFTFNSLPPVQAKGYDKPVQILEPVFSSPGNKKKKSSVPLIGRQIEKESIQTIARAILENPVNSQSTMVFLMGESGMGKSALGISVMDDIKKAESSTDDSNESRIIVSARSTTTETEQRIPLSTYRRVFMSIVHDLCDYDGTLALTNSERDLSVTSGSTKQSTNEPTSGSTRRSMRLRGSFYNNENSEQSRGPAQRPTLMRSKALGDFNEGEGDDNASKKHSGIQSNGTELGPTGTRLGLGSTSTHTSRSMHGDPTRRSQVLSQSVHRRSMAKKESLGVSLHRLSTSRSVSLIKSPNRGQSLRFRRSLAVSQTRDDSSQTSFDTSVHTRKGAGHVPYFEKLCWACEELDYPYEYADIVGSQFLGLDGASPVTHIEGHVPTMDELVEFLALAFLCIADYADLTIVFLDDFQWVDSFSWKIFLVLCKRGKRLLIMCATRSHDKQALRRLSTAASGGQLQQQMVEISLGPLDFAEIRQLIATVLNHSESAVSDGLCADIFQRTGGLPVYVVQVLENIKRKKTVELDFNGVLQWTAEGLKEKRSTATSKGAVMEETFLARFDSLDVGVRKVLQTCAVLGLSFSLSDLIRVHPEMEELDIENAIEIAIDEMILVEHAEDDESESMGSGGPTDSDSMTFANSARSGRSVEGGKSLADRSFQFSHAMWRQSVLTTMLKQRKIELHRLIAEAMEKDQVLILEQSDISRLLTLFDHWKSCGDFCKTAPLALAVGSRLEEWDLCAQSLELYEDALEMSFDSVQTVEGEGDTNEWVQVSAKPAVLDYILRLHIRIGLCRQSLGDEFESIGMFEDAYNIMKSSSKIPGMSKSLMIPIISSLCVLKLDRVPHDRRTRLEQAKLAEKFVKEAIENGNPVHVGRALSMEAIYYAGVGDLDRALDNLDRLKTTYDVETHSFDMLAEYGRDFALECHCESVQWLYLLQRHDEAEEHTDTIIEHYLPLLDPVDADVAMYAIMPLIQVLKLLERAKDADWLLRKYVIKPHQDNFGVAEYWAPLFNPLVSLLELNVMEENDDYDDHALDRMETWVLDDENREYSPELERKAHTIMGELCWRLMNFKDDDDPVRELLSEKARELLTPIARYPHQEIFLKHTARALLEAL